MAANTGSMRAQSLSTETGFGWSHPSFTSSNKGYLMDLTPSKCLTTSVGYRSFHVSSRVAQQAEEEEDTGPQDLGSVAAREIAYEQVSY